MRPVGLERALMMGRVAGKVEGAVGAAKADRVEKVETGVDRAEEEETRVDRAEKVGRMAARVATGRVAKAGRRAAKVEAANRERAQRPKSKVR